MLQEFKAFSITMYVAIVHGLAAFGVGCIYMYTYAPLELCRPALKGLMQFWR